MSTSPTILQSLKAGLIASAAIAAVNLVYHFVYVAITGIALPPTIGPVQVIMSSFMPTLLASLGWFGLGKFFPSKAQTIFVVVVMALALLSIAGSFSDPLPDGSPAPAGFAVWSAPMHVVAGVFTAWLVPRFAPGKA